MDVRIFFFYPDVFWSFLIIQVSPYPDINVHERQSTDDLLLLACDGLWDVMTNAEAVAQVRELYQSGETSVAKIAEEMLDVSLNKGKFE